MRTQFSKNVLSASVAAVFALGAVSVATPVFANQFSDTAIATSNTVGVTVPKTSNATATGINVVFTENIAGAVLGSNGSAITTTNPANIVLKLDNSAKFALTSTTIGSVSGTQAFALANGNLGTASTTSADGLTFTGAINNAIRIANTSGGTSYTVTVNLQKADGTALTAVTYSTPAAATASTAMATNIAAAINTSLNTQFSTTSVVYATAVGSDILLDQTKVVIKPQAAAVTQGTADTTTYRVGNLPNVVGGKLYIQVASNVTSTAATLSVNGFNFDTTGSTAGTAVNLSVDSAPTGWTSGNSIKIGTVAAGAATVTAAATAVNVAQAATSSIPNLVVTETFGGDLAATTTTAAPIKVTLSGGLTFDTNTTPAVAFGGSFTTTLPAANRLLSTATAIGSGYSALTLAYNAGVASVAGTLSIVDATGAVTSATVPTFNFATDAATSAANFKTALETAFVGATGKAFTTTPFTISGATVSIDPTKGAFVKAATIDGGDNGNTFVIPTGKGNAIVSAATQLVIPVQTATVYPAAAGTVTVSNIKAVVPAGQAVGTYNATVASTLNVGGTATATSGSVPVATVATKATTAAIADTNSPAKGVATLFTGRAGQSPFPAGVTIKFAETAVGVVTAGSILTLTPSTGAKLATVSSANKTGTSIVFNPFTVASGVASASVSAQSTTSTSADWNDITISSLDLSGLTTPGDVTVAVGGNPSITPATVTIAKAINATSASAGAAVNGTAGATITLPDLTITESQVAAVVANATSGFAANSSTISGFNTTSATVKAFTASGSDVSSTLGLSGLTAATGTGSDAASFVTFTQTSQSTATTGPVTYKISGLKAVLTSSASGSIGITAAGIDTTKTIAQHTADTGSKLTPAALTVANVAPPTTPTYPVPVVADQTKAVFSGLKFLPAGNDQSKPGNIYVAVIFNGVVFFVTPAVAPATTATLTPYVAGKSPAPYANSLSPLDININTLPLDLTPFKGLQLIAGYGIGVTGLSDPFANMLAQSTYNVIYTVK